MKHYLDFAQNIVGSAIRRPSFPYKLTFALTYWCNSRCQICRIWERKPKGELTTEEVQQFFRKNRFFNWIDITGGEVFLRKDLVTIVRTILKTSRNLYMLHIPTNSLLPERITSQVEQILKLKPPRFILTLSLDGPERTHDQLRGVKGNWRKVVETYRLLRPSLSDRFEIYFGMTLSEHNYDQIEAMYQELKQEIPELRRNAIHFNVAHYSSHYYGNYRSQGDKKHQIVKSMQQFLRKRSWRFSGVELLERIFQRLLATYAATGKTPIPCQAFSGSFFLDSWGKIYPCTMWNKPIGNIKDFGYDLKQFWQLAQVKKLRSLASQRKCPNCWTACEAYQSILSSGKHALKLFSS